MSPRPRLLRVTAVVLVLLTVAVVVVDLARPGLADPLRAVVATAAAPAQSALAGWDDDRVRELTEERDALAAEVTRLREQARRHGQLETLERATTWGDHELVPARVVAFAAGTTPVGGRTVTIDVGRRDGVREDQTVVSADGLVGRVLRTSPVSSDVLLLGDPGVVVGVRYGDGAGAGGATDGVGSGALGSVAATTPPGLPARGHGELTLTALGDSPISVGDPVTTLGSPDDRPYVARVPLGTVTSVDPDRGQLSRTAVVTPHVDTDTLDLVAVVFPERGRP
jgi:rod shape-determining protein MreC